MDLDFLLSSLPIKVNNYELVSGGDINTAYVLYTGAGTYFIKCNSLSKYNQLFEKEINGLNNLRNTLTILVPEIIQTGECGDTQYLLMEYIKRGEETLATWKDFGSSLANMHRISQPYFGFEENNYIGNLPQNNTKSKSWEELYGNYHILPLVKMLVDQKKFVYSDIKTAENFCKKIKDIFPEESPSLVHGDL